MRIAIIDGTPEDVSGLETILKKLSENLHTFFDITTFSDSDEFISRFKKNDFEVIFIDICTSGTEIAKSLRKLDRHCTIIFLASTSEHMPFAFSCHAFEYIQKPFTTERIINVITEALEILPAESRYVEFISNRQTVRAFLNDIVSVVTDAHYLDITILNGKKYHCRMTMPEFLKKTGTDPRFIPINRGITVNAEHIIKFENNCCIIRNGTKFPVRVRESALVEQMARDYNFEKILRHQQTIPEK